MKSIFLILILVSNLDYKIENCPHANFSRKHWCKDCVTEEDALEFSLPRIGQTGLNSVLAGTLQDLDFQINSDRGLCQNEKLGVVFECNLERRNCRLRGKQCTTYHHTGNGHMYYQSTRCHDNP